MRKNIFKKISIVFLLLITITINLIFPLSRVNAQSANYNWYGQPFHEWYLKVYDKSNPQEIFGERYTAAQVQWVLYSIPSFFLNLILGQNTELASCMMMAFTEKTADVGTCLDGTKSMFSGLFSYIGNSNLAAKEENKNFFEIIFQDKQLSGITYLKNTFERFRMIPTVNAQTEGYGFRAIGPVSELWKISRNFAFAIFSIAIIIFSFMIMFRVKINPQTVITIQSALPKIIIAMILVTFSYAIAGFMIDLMYIITGLISLLFSINSGPNNHLNQWFRFLTGELILVKVEGVLTLIIYSLAYLIMYIVACIYALLSIYLIMPLPINNAGSTIIAVLLLVFTLILIFILVINLFRVTWMLFQNLAQFYMQVIIGPLQIALGTIVPNVGFGSWLKGIVTKLSVFPAIGVLWYLSFRFLWASFQMSTKILVEQNFIAGLAQWFAEKANEAGIMGFSDINPNWVGDGFAWNPPFIGSGSLPIVFILMSLSCIMIMPKVAKAIESLMAGREFDFGTAIGEATGPLKTVGGWASKEATETATPWLAGEARRYLSSKGLENRKLGKILVNVLTAVSRQEKDEKGIKQAATPQEVNK